MPELPEVETIRRSLSGIAGAQVVRARIDDRRLTRPASPEQVAAGLAGAALTEPGRRGKYLLFGLGDGRTLLVHLRMTGAFLLCGPDEALPEPHLRAVIELADGRRLAYTDVRRFGTWSLLGPDELDEHLDARLGPEPLAGWQQGALGAALAGQRRPLLSALLDQRTVAGVGTIYAMEALHAAGLDPRRRADGLSADEAGRLQDAVVAALRAGIGEGGTSLRDYRRADGSRGRMQERLRIYGRAGEPCPGCGTTIMRAVIGGRGAAWCPSCQPPA